MKTDLLPGLDRGLFHHTARERMYEDAWRLWGERSQVAMLAEEATELSLAVQHHLRGRDSDLAGEIADVLITIEQACEMYPDLWGAVKDRAEQKLSRLRGRIAKAEQESEDDRE